MAEPLTCEHFQEIVTAILSVSQPAAIILFGSYARDQVHKFSDVDLLVIRDAEFRAGER
jgi:predicted nucleotidyltransferase